MVMTRRALRREPPGRPQVKRPSPPAVAQTMTSGWPCIRIAMAPEATATTPLRMARTFLLGMSLSGRSCSLLAVGTGLRLFQFFCRRGRCSLGRALYERRHRIGQDLDRHARGDLHFRDPVVHLDELADEPRVGRHPVSLLQRRPRARFLLLSARHQKKEGDEDDEHHQDRHEARQRRTGLTAAARRRLRVLSYARRRGLRLNVLREKKIAREEGGWHRWAPKKTRPVGSGRGGRRDSR